jgi:hypothetical protein
MGRQQNGRQYMPSAKKPTDVQAVEGVHSILLNLDAETRTRVLRAVEALLAMPEPASPPTTSTGGAPSPGSSGHQPGILQNEKIAAFITRKHPIDTYQRLACLAYFLEHKEGKTDIFSKDLENANTEARQIRLANTTRVLDHAARRLGFFASSSRGKKRLTSRGVAVVEALPDQAAVKTALQEYSMPKKGGRRARSHAKTKSGKAE